MYFLICVVLRLAICWLSEGVNYCKQQALFVRYSSCWNLFLICRGQGSAPVLTSSDVSNLFILFTNVAIIQIGCLKEQVPVLRQVLKHKFRPCSGDFFVVILCSDWCK